MFEVIETPTTELTLQQKKIREVMTECGNKLAIIDKNAGLIAEAEVLADRLKGKGLERAPCAAITVTTDRIDVRILITFEMLSTVRAAISAAGLHIFAEERLSRSHRPSYELTDQITVTLVGFDVQIVIDSIVNEVVLDQEAA